jgi:small subunit ribosomal protein S17
MSKTIVVKVTRLVHHAKYSKVIRKYSSYKVHDEKNTAKIGDTVRIQETRPISKDKRWRLIEVLK